jgi:CHAT domain-containing protein/tetratricopeptide (TPR) repeat protein
MWLFDWLGFSAKKATEELLAEARIRAGQGDSQGALQLYEKIRRRDRTPAILVEMGQACLAADNGLAALDYAREALALNPNCAPAFCIQGEVLLREDRGGDARQRFQEAARLDPGSEWANRRLAEFATASESGGAEEPVPSRSARAREPEATKPDEALVRARLSELSQVFKRVYEGRQLQQALSLAQQSLEMARAYLGEVHPEVATGLNNLAGVYYALGNYAEAEPLHQQALAIRRTTLGEDHPDFAASLNNLAWLYYSRGNYAAAEPLCRQALDVLGKSLGEDHPDYGDSLDKLASLDASLGNYAEAELFHRRALAIRRAALGENHPHVATSLHNLALLYHSMGNDGEAESLFRQALAILRAARQEDHPEYAATLSYLAMLCASRGNSAEADRLARQSLATVRAALGENHPHFAASLNTLAELCASVGNYAEAERLHRQALAVCRATLGEDHPDFAAGLHNLAHLYHHMGNYAEAEPLYRQVLAIRREALGEDHPLTADCLIDLAGLCVAQNRAEEAMPLLQQAEVINHRMIGQMFSFCSERQRADFLRKTYRGLEAFLSLVLRHFRSSGQAVEAALELVLRRKAVGAEALAAQRDAVLGGRYPELQPHLRQLSNLRMQIAQKVLGGPEPESLQNHQQHLAELTAQKERLEAELARRVPEMNLEKQLRAADGRAVALALPAGVTLVEFVRFHVFDPQAVPARGERRWQPARYLAFVLPGGQPDSVRMIDLGEAESIDRLIADFRAGVTGVPENPRNRVQESTPPDAVAGGQVGHRLRAAVFDKLAVAAGACQRLLLAPDGDLTRLPFEALPSADGRLLIDGYQISYLGCARDVLRFGAESAGQPGDCLVVADPAFDLVAGPGEVPVGTSPPRQSRALNRSVSHFDPLPATRLEGERIAGMLGVVPWLGSAALEGPFKKQRSPRILHLATHGFFLADQERDPNQEIRDLGMMGGVPGSGLGRLTGPGMENPLLRSGLALAGAQTWLNGGQPPAAAEDGLLTAEDVSGMDLLATELVVLSACETGLGEVRTGEGVFGLQRAFVLAGAKTLVMSLWSVPDESTRELMEDFYQRILSGQPRADALRAAQLALRSRYPDPFFWGAFVCQGDPGPLPAWASRLSAPGVLP